MKNKRLQTFTNASKRLPTHAEYFLARNLNCTNQRNDLRSRKPKIERVGIPKN